MSEQFSVKILTGWSRPGGSTTAHINLCNLFNSNGLNCTLYGPHDYHLNKCQSDDINKYNPTINDITIVHFINITKRPPCKKLIYSCHETNIMPIKSIAENIYDYIHFVSHGQYLWHNLIPDTNRHVIIPNVINQLNKSPLNTNTAGVIGSIDRHKQTHLSIERALKDGYKNILLYGMITDTEYYDKFVKNFIDQGQVKYIGHLDDKQKMYDSIDTVYHSSLRETFNLIKAECYFTKVKYDGLESTKTDAELWDNKLIFDKWKNIIDN